jgi:MFS family permease
MFYQLRSFDESLPDSTIAAQAGMMAAGFTGAQFMTAMMWGRISDSDRGGRKMVILIGLSGTGRGETRPCQKFEHLPIYVQRSLF